MSAPGPSESIDKSVDIELRDKSTAKAADISDGDGVAGSSEVAAAGSSEPGVTKVTPLPPNRTGGQQFDTLPPSASEAEGTSAAAVKPTPEEPEAVESESVVESTPTEQPAAASNSLAVKISILTLNNKRKQFTVNKSLLRKSNQLPDSEDPLDITVYTLKEIIWQGWEADWDAKPSGPAGIRLIHLGQMLQDNTPLKDTRITREQVNVMHITVKPQDPEDSEEQTKNPAGRTSGSNRSRGGSCCIVM